MSDRFDEMAIAWFAKLPALASEVSARRYLARFLREAVAAELTAERPRAVSAVLRALAGETCVNTVDGQRCGKPAEGVCRQQKPLRTHLKALCEGCAAIAGVLEDGEWVRTADLVKPD